MKAGQFQILALFPGEIQKARVLFLAARLPDKRQKLSFLPRGQR